MMMKRILLLSIVLLWLIIISLGIRQFWQDNSSSIKKEFSQTAKKLNSNVTSEEEYLVKRVIDGDTIELEGGQRVRYIGINTPETSDPRKGRECFGQEAKEENKKLVEGKKVRLEKDISETDQYHRLLRYIYIQDLFVNEYLVTEGFARVSTFPPDVKFQTVFQKAERKAREQNKGLWSGCPPRKL